MNITNKGKGWEFRNSLWLIWLFVIMVNWVAFFWIGARAKQRKWILFGWMYLILCLVFPVIGVMDGIKDTVLGDIFIYVCMVAWVVSVVHAFLLRKEYLIRREMIINNIDAANAAYRQQIQNRYIQSYGYPQQYGCPQQHGYPHQNAYSPTQQNVPPVNQPQPPMQQTTPIVQASQASVQKINLNVATEQQLTSLPGVGVALAKRAVELRSETGGFASVQDFCGRLGLMPHFAAQIESLAFAEPPKTKKPLTESSGRVIDI